MPDPELTIERVSASRFIATLDGHEVCRTAFAAGDGVWEIFSTVTASGYEGRGIAGRLVRHVLGEAEAAGVQVVPSCWYVARVMRQDSPRWDGLLYATAPPPAEAGDACRIAPVVVPRS